MNINWPILSIVAVLVIAFLIYVIRRNVKDESKFDMDDTGDTNNPKEIDEDRLPRL